MDVKGTGDVSVVEEVNVSIVSLPGIKFNVNKFFDPASKAAGKVFDIFWGKKHAEQVRHQLLTKIQTDIDMQLIESGKARYDIETSTLTDQSNNFKNLLLDSIQNEEITNVLHCIFESIGSVDEEDQPEQPSRDFINRWKNEAKQIDSANLRNLWGRILAEEINNPETISLRTLDTIRNISQKEATIFSSQYSNIGFNNYLIVEVDKNKPPRYGTLNEEQQLALNDAGLVDKSNINISYPWLESDNITIDNTSIPCYYFETSEFLFLVPKKESKSVPKTTCLRLTSTGHSIFKILDPPTDPEKSLNILLKLFKETIINDCEINFIIYAKKSDDMHSLNLIYHHYNQ